MKRPHCLFDLIFYHCPIPHLCSDHTSLHTPSIILSHTLCLCFSSTLKTYFKKRTFFFWFLLERHQRGLYYSSYIIEYSLLTPLPLTIPFISLALSCVYHIYYHLIYIKRRQSTRIAAFEEL